MAVALEEENRGLIVRSVAELIPELLLGFYFHIYIILTFEYKIN